MAFQSTINHQPSLLLKQVLHVDREEIGYLRFTIESYDGMAVVTTVDPYAALIEVCISPGCEETLFELLASLKHDEGLKIKKVPN